MAEGAALLVDTLLPAVAYRQFGLSFEGSLAVRLGYDRELLRRVCQCFARRILQSIRHRVKRHHERPSVADLHPGFIIVVQRFRSDLGLYTHLHVLATDGAFVDTDAGPRWLAAPPLEREQLVGILELLHEDLRDVLDHDGAEEPDVDPSLATCVHLSLTGPHPVASLAQPPRPSPCSFPEDVSVSTRRRRSTAAIASSSSGFVDISCAHLLLTMPSKHSRTATFDCT